MRIFFEASVLFSAAKSDGAVRRLLGLLVDAGHECWADGYVVEEARRNPVAKSPSGAPVPDTLLARMHVAAAQPHPAALEATFAVPEKGRPVLAAAIRLKCETLVTGDRTHFGAFYGKALAAVTIYCRACSRKPLSPSSAPKIDFWRSLRRPRRRPG